MKRTTIGSLVVTGAGIAAFTLTPLNAYARRFVNYVTLQATSPGTPDNGHIHVKGDILSDGIFTGDGSGLTNVTATNFAIPGTISGNGKLIINTTGASADPYSVEINSPTRALHCIATDMAVYGNGAGQNGGVAQFQASTGNGVFGLSYGTYASAIGVEGENFSANGIGVRGYNSQGVGVFGYSGNSNGISAKSASNDGLFATTLASNKSAVYGMTSVPDSRGAWFQSNATTGGGIGVVGQTNSSSGYGVFSYGNTGATGTKSFLIDDPTDPANSTLRHYSTEGPEPLNEYTGTIRTDSKGYGTVVLPDYFDAINKDPRYQLTVIDEADSADFVLAKVVRKEAANRFMIRTSKPGIEVSWQVKAIRNDPWMQKNGAPVREEKSQANKGHYLQPELYGQPATAGIGYQPPTKAPMSTLLKAR